MSEADKNQEDSNVNKPENSEGENASQSEESKKKSKDGRNTAAKAFYRAMYAGAEPDPEEFGLQTSQDETAAASGSSTGGSCAFCERMQSDIEQMEAKNKEIEDLYKRLMADFENFRKRTDRERKEFTGLGMQSAVEALLPALDDLSMAREKLTADSDPATLLESLNMVYNRFNRCLEQIGVKQLDVIGQPFDPMFHEPVQQVPTLEFPDGAIVHQLRAGYLYHEKVMRPALVNVATHDGAPPLAAKEEIAENNAEIERQEPVDTSADSEIKAEKQPVSSSTLDSLIDKAVATQELPTVQEGDLADSLMETEKDQTVDD